MSCPQSLGNRRLRPSCQVYLILLCLKSIHLSRFQRTNNIHLKVREASSVQCKTLCQFGNLRTDTNTRRNLRRRRFLTHRLRRSKTALRSDTLPETKEARTKFDGMELIDHERSKSGIFESVSKESGFTNSTLDFRNGGRALRARGRTFDLEAALLQDPDRGGVLLGDMAVDENGLRTDRRVAQNRRPVLGERVPVPCRKRGHARGLFVPLMLEEDR